MSKNKFTRRDFVASGISLGFAAAVGPISALAISTDSKGLLAGDTRILVGSESIPGYWASPKTKGPHPIIIVCHEIFGVHEHIRDVCRRFAKQGFLALAPDLYSRYGDVTKMKEIDEIVSKVVSKVSMDQVFRDLDAAIAHAQKHDGDPNRMSITGFCWGGRTVWLYASRNSNLKAGVAWYGPLVSANATQEAPVQIAAKLKVPVLGLYGGKDTHILPDHVHQMEEALKKGNSDSKIVVYPESPHGFFADYRDTYRKMDAEDGWKKALSWLKEHKAV
jgi:carboxymethylenebutenolidase